MDAAKQLDEKHGGRDLKNRRSPGGSSDIGKVPALSRWATFDVYGTLIDWNGGIAATLGRLWPDRDAGALLHAYHDIEPLVEREHAAATYREVLARCLRALAEREGLLLRPDDEGALGDSLPGWQPFPEVPAALAELRRRGWKLAPLSNTDPDFLEASLGHLGVPVDARVVASEIGSYKPAHGHWTAFFERTGADRRGHVHVAASLFHDIAPANELGLRSVWINRLGEAAGPRPTRELPDLGRLPDVLDELVPA
jgi:2-haloalkanoic acid dehalogenase type II